MTNLYIHVKPTEGSRVRNPQADYAVIPAEGAQVKLDRYFTDRINAGELIKTATAEASSGVEKTEYAPKADEKEYYPESDLPAPNKDKPKK